MFKNNLRKKIISFMLAVSMCCMLPGMSVVADTLDFNDTPYLALGADLSQQQKKTVLELLGIQDTDLSQYKVVQVTNQEEHDYLGDYLSASVIGKKALSSVLVTQAKKDSGISVETHNINYCTDVMYCNALVTAGIVDADVVVAGPFKLTGTAALVGTIKAYAEMTGTEVSKDNIDAATNELVLTGELGDELGEELGGEEGKESAGELMALVKQKVVEGKLSKPADIMGAVDDSCKELNINISDDTKRKIADVMGKISKLDLDMSTLKTQVKDLYSKLSDLNLDTEGIWDKICSFFSKVVDFLAGLF